MFVQPRRVNDRSPIALMKSVKNDVEIAGMRSAHVSDIELSTCVTVITKAHVTDIELPV